MPPRDLTLTDRVLLRAAMAWCWVQQTRAAAVAAWWHRPRVARWAENPANWCDHPDGDPI